MTTGAPHHPRCVYALATDAGPDEGETRSAFAARSIGFRCTCRDLLALELEPRILPYIRKPITEMMLAALNCEIRAFLADLDARTGFRPEYDLVELGMGVFQVVWYLQGKAEHERRRLEAERLVRLETARVYNELRGSE